MEPCVFVTFGAYGRQGLPFLVVSESNIAHVISLLEMHVGLSEIESKQLLQMAGRKDFDTEDREMLKAMGETDADTAAALRNSILLLKKWK